MRSVMQMSNIIIYSVQWDYDASATDYYRILCIVLYLHLCGARAFRRPTYYLLLRVSTTILLSSWCGFNSNIPRRSIGYASGVNRYCNIISECNMTARTANEIYDFFPFKFSSATAHLQIWEFILSLWIFVMISVTLFSEYCL